MALANVAFLAAMNNLRVLVMDWDLEAPGLHHYFRGLIDADEMAELRAAPGILDLAWSWRNGIDQARDAEAIDAQFESFRTGNPFESLVRTIMTDPSTDGWLDIIPAGGDMVATPQPVEYERALAALSWNELLDRYAGGGLIDTLRNWASSNYDLILVDSRTGLADVAGICTMQLPDAVVLCFVLNRQNIEGVSRVASAIRHNRGDDVKIWSVPMRVSREGTNEEADASARALRELTRPGRLDREATERDLKSLLIKAEPNVPFMESLSAFNETNAALDPLTANLARLASEIIGRQIQIPEISEQWRDLVLSRLAPTLSTDSYLRQLLNAEPSRAARQLHGYVESAIATLADGDDLPEDYAQALAETTIAFHQRGELADPEELYDTPYRLVILLRKLHERSPDAWRGLLVQALEATLNADMFWMGGDDEAVTLDEIDELLASEEQNFATIERRITLRLRAARILESAGSFVQQLNTAEDALALIKIALKHPDGIPGDLQVLRCEALLHRASAQERLGQLEDAAETLRKIIKSIEKRDVVEGPEAQRFIAEASYRLMRLLRVSDPHEAARLALVAAQSSPLNNPSYLGRIPEYVDAIRAGAHPQAAAAQLLGWAVAPSGHQRLYTQYFGRAPAAATRLILAFSYLLPMARDVLEPAEHMTLGELTTYIVEKVVSSNVERSFGSTRNRPGSRHALSLLPAFVDAIGQYLSVVHNFMPSELPEGALVHLEVIAQDLRKLVKPGRNQSLKAHDGSN